LRCDGALSMVEGWPPLEQQELESVLATVTAHDPARRTSFDATGDLDLAYTPTDLPRFRVNGFRQRGSISFAFRAIPSRVPSFQGLGLPEGVTALAAAGPRRRPDRRAPRRRHRADGTPGGRVRPPRALDPAHDRRRGVGRAHHRVLPAGEAAAGPVDSRGRAARRRQPAAAARRL